MKLIETDDLGNWGVKGLPWKDLYPGQVITQKTYEKIYACLTKLMHYEEVGPSPEQLEEIDEVYQAKCKEVGQYKPLEGYVYNGQQLYIKESEGK